MTSGAAIRRPARLSLTKLPITLVEHLQGIAIACHLPVFPGVLQAAFQLVHRLADEHLRIDLPRLDPVGRMPSEPEPVVLLLGLRVPEDAVGLAGFLEASLRLFVAGMEIGVVLFRQLPVDTLDLLRRSVLIDPQYFVVIPHGMRTITYVKA